jgi:hypothetical protein
MLISQLAVGETHKSVGVGLGLFILYILSTPNSIKHTIHPGWEQVFFDAVIWLVGWLVGRLFDLFCGGTFYIWPTLSLKV